MKNILFLLLIVIVASSAHSQNIYNRSFLGDFQTVHLSDPVLENDLIIKKIKKKQSTITNQIGQEKIVNINRTEYRFHFIKQNFYLKDLEGKTVLTGMGKYKQIQLADHSYVSVKVDLFGAVTFYDDKDRKLLYVWANPMGRASIELYAPKMEQSLQLLVLAYEWSRDASIRSGIL